MVAFSEIPKPAVIRAFKIPVDASGKTLDVHITEPPHVRADNLNLETWASSNILAGALHTLDLAHSVSDLQDNSETGPIPILELGAGTALVGITAVAVCRVGAILTDLPGIVPGIAANIDANDELLRTAGANVVAGSLDWRTPSKIICADGREVPSARKARILFAADTVYDENHPELLEKVAVEWLERDPRAMFVICYSLRVAYLDVIRDLWARFEAAGLTAAAEGRATGEATNGDDELLCEWVVWRWDQTHLS